MAKHTATTEHVFNLTWGDIADVIRSFYTLKRSSNIEIQLDGDAMDIHSPQVRLMVRITDVIEYR